MLVEGCCCVFVDAVGWGAGGIARWGPTHPWRGSALHRCARRCGCSFWAVFRAQLVPGTDTLASTFFSRTPSAALMCPRAFGLGPQRARECWPLRLSRCRDGRRCGHVVLGCCGGVGGVPTHEPPLVLGSCSRCYTASAATAPSETTPGEGAGVVRGGAAPLSLLHPLAHLHPPLYLHVLSHAPTVGCGEASTGATVASPPIHFPMSVACCCRSGCRRGDG